MTSVNVWIYKTDSQFTIDQKDANHNENIFWTFSRYDFEIFPSDPIITSEFVKFF